MLYSNGVTLAVKVCLVAAVTLVAALGSPYALAQQSDSRIEILVCPSPSESDLRIITPRSDSIVNQARVVIEGEVEFISQIDLFVDDVYGSTVALGHSATAFRSSTTLAPGTHTLRLVASDSCSKTIHTRQIVVTYEPQATPGVGADAPTIITAPGDEADIITTPVENPALGLFETALPRPITSPPPSALEHVSPKPPTDMGQIFGNEATDTILRTSLLVAGGAVLAMPAVTASVAAALTQVGGLAQGAASATSTTAPVVSKRMRYYILAKIIGAALLLLPFVI